MASEERKNNFDNLTNKQKRFCEEYLVDLNATQAAIRAGYSPKTARSIANENLTKPAIQAYLAKLNEERMQRVKISQDDVLRELAHIAFDDIKNYLSFRTEKVQVGVDEEDNPIYLNKHVVDFKDSNEIDTRSIQEITVGANGALKIKLYSKDEALVNLGRHLGIFNDKLTVDATVSVKKLEDFFEDNEDIDDTRDNQ